MGDKQKNGGNQNVFAEKVITVFKKENYENQR